MWQSVGPSSFDSPVAAGVQIRGPVDQELLVIYLPHDAAVEVIKAGPARSGVSRSDFTRIISIGLSG